MQAIRNFFVPPRGASGRPTARSTGRPPSRRPIPDALARAVLGPVLLGLALPLLAQDDVGDAADDSALQLEEITVTGTRIKGLDLKGAVQQVQFDRNDILESGAETVGQYMQDLVFTGGGVGTFTPATGGPLSSDTPAGAAAVSLRGLGTSSTLTLINGRRATVSSFARGQESFIDINSIPNVAVERIEILLSGASAMYGADAVAGVVNVVLRDDFEGLELSASYGDSTASSDNSRTNLGAAWGWGNDRHHVTAILDYFHRDPLFDRDREITRNSIRPSQQGFFPSFNDLFFMFFDQTEEPQDGGCPEEDFGFGSFGEFCEVNVNEFTAVFDEYESIGGMVTYTFDISDRVRWFNELIYQQYDSNGTGSPANFSRSPIDPENPFWPQALIDDMVEEGSFEGVQEWEDYFGFPIFAWGKIPEPRAINVESETMRVVTGFDIDLNEDWNLNTGLLYGRNENTQEGLSGLVINEAFLNANLGNLCTDGTVVNRWDLDLVGNNADFVGNTCEDIGLTTLWYNAFGGQGDQPAGIDEFLRTQARRSGESELWTLDATASGPLFELNSYTVQSAIGVEWRRESVFDVPSGVAVATTLNPEPILGFSSTSADAERDYYGAFIELFIPITLDFDIQLAGRYDYFDSFGGDFNPKVAFRWNPSESLIFRGNFSTSYRAPSLAQVGAGTLLSSYTVNCMMTPEACDGDPLADGAALLSEDVANDNLEPETATTWGVGFIWSPTADIDLSVDYWNIEYEDVIGVDEDDFIRRAFAGEFPIVGVGELPTGQPGLEVDGGFVRDAHFQLSNLGIQDTSGIDLTYTQYFDLGPGVVTLLADATYLLEYKRQSSPVSPVIDEAGLFTYPEVLVNARVRYRTDRRWSGYLGLRYTGEYQDDPAPRTLDALGIPRGTIIDVDDWLVFDLNLTYDFTEDNWLSLNVRNLFDEEPPLVLGTGANVDQINHSSMGQFVTLRYTHRFGVR